MTDQVLYNEFKKFPSVYDCKVHLDVNTNKSRGFAFVRFRLKDESEQAMATMDNHVLFGRKIRVRRNYNSTGPPQYYKNV